MKDSLFIRPPFQSHTWREEGAAGVRENGFNGNNINTGNRGDLRRAGAGQLFIAWPDISLAFPGSGCVIEDEIFLQLDHMTMKSYSPIMDVLILMDLQWQQIKAQYRIRQEENPTASMLFS